jgi:hypothetical protein
MANQQPDNCRGERRNQLTKILAAVSDILADAVRAFLDRLFDN